MTICDDLRQSVLQAAIQGKLTKQLPEDGSAADLLASIKAEKEQLIEEKKIKKEKPLEPISSDEIPFDIPDNWEWVKLGELTSKIGAGNTPPGGKNSDVYVENGIKFIRSMNVYNDGLHYNGIVYISQGLANGRANSAVYAKDILLNITGGSIGRCALVPDDFDLGNVNQHVLIIRNIDENNRAYIHLCICSPMVQSIIMDKAVGDKAGFSAEKAKNLLIPLPPIAEQHRIVARVDELMAKIDELEAVEKELVALKEAFPGDMKASLLQAAMQGKLTQQLPEESVAEIENYLHIDSKLCPIKDVPFDIPENWKWIQIGNLGESADTDSFADGPFGSYLKREHQISEHEVRIIQLSNIGENGWKNENEKYTSYDHLEKVIPRCEVTPGCFVIAKMMPAGRTILVPELGTRITLGSDAMKFKPNSMLNKKYLLYAMRSQAFLGQVYAEVHGITRVRTTLNGVKGYVLPIPPLAEQQRIVEKLDKLLPLCDALKEDGVA